MAGLGREARRLPHSDVITSTRSLDEPGLGAVRRVFAAAGSAAEHEDAAGLLEDAHPGIGAMLRTYGAVDR